ncbi:hypothetical protein OAB01_02075 [Bacteroidia bacterium]|nr:hypothetical protein [Bacteroidia bacterium]
MILTLIHSCKPESFGDSPIPEIELEAIEVLKHPVTNLDSLIIAVINYKDGDGDIGLSDSDTFSPFRFGEPYFNNLWIDLEYKENGNWILASDDSLQLSQRIANLTPVGDVKSVRGTLRLRIPVKPTLFFAHTQIRYRFTLVDRSLQESNKEQSNELTLNY